MVGLIKKVSKAPIKKSKVMKRIGNLYEKIISVENLRLADKKARRGKRRSYGVRHHDKNREANIIALHNALRTKTYKTSKYDVFTIFEPKERQIYRLPYYPDRIVHHAIMNVLEPIWLKVFTYNTYSSIKGRGIRACARQVSKIINSYKGEPLYCLKIDIKKFYPSIDNGIIKQIIRKKIKDKDLLWLLDEIIDSTNGLTIGNYISQFLANLYLAYFMHNVNEVLKLKATEYADDICFFSNNKIHLHNAFKKIRSYLAALNLEVKGNFQIFPIATTRYDKHGRGLDYIGYKFYRRQKLIRKSIKKKFCRCVTRINKRQKRMTPIEYKQNICSWLGWAKYSDSKHLLKSIIKQEYYDTCIL